MRHRCHRRVPPVITARRRRGGDSRVSDVNPGEDLVEVLCGEAVEAVAVRQQLVQLLHGNVAARSRDIRRRRLFGGTQVLLHGASSPELLSDDPLLGAREDPPVAHVHFIFLWESCARCLRVYKVSGGASAPLSPPHITANLQSVYVLFPVISLKVKADEPLKRVEKLLGSLCSIINKEQTNK